MMNFISLLGGIPTLLLTAGGAILGVLMLWFRAKARRQEETIDRLTTVNQAHQKIEQVHQEADTINAQAQQEIREVQDRVDKADSPEQAAQEVCTAINDFFNPKSK